MRLSEELCKIGIEAECINEKDFSSLGLAGYNAGEGACTFLAAAKYVTGLSEGISMILTSEEVYEELSREGKLGDGYGICIVENPRLAYFTLHNALSDSDEYNRPRFETRIAESAKISPLAYIAPYNVEIGENTVIEEFVSIKGNTIIGDDCVIRAGTVVGGEGFEIKNTGTGLLTVTHIGGVKLGNNVEIQQNANVDKAIYPWDDTIVDSHVRINSLVQIAHGVKIGAFTEIAASASIQGRVRIGKDVWIGPGSVIRNGISVGEKSRVNMGAVVTLSVPEGSAVSGNFARSHESLIDEMKQYKEV
ncbi:MAG: UDP-3-O-(3-hydroxymyristoyl)glucosamine N-acyltransferase [Mogibacterium sp.]|nr:UDP-3-O-(3-hydroxymyristoyl)glucosamine N-acyltransferase [Mogibacterium sp.]